MKISFTVIGPPQGKGRPKFSRHEDHVTARTPDKTVVYENYIRMQYQAQCGHRFADDAALDLRVTAYFQIPASAGKKKKAAMESGEIRPTKAPDVDNIVKAVADALQGAAYKDDKNIVDAQIRKFYSFEPRLEVSLHSV